MADDYDLDQMWDDLACAELDDGQPLTTQTCSYCGRSGLSWVKSGGRWRLGNELAVHVCSADWKPDGLAMSFASSPIRDGVFVMEFLNAEKIVKDWVYDTKDAIIRQRLIEAGWTPPK